MTRIVLIPGLLCDETVWRPMLNALGNNATVADLSTQDSITRMAEDCLGLSDDPLRIAGHSMGARVAMEMAHLAPERIERLALLDTGCHPLKPGEPEKRASIVALAHEKGMEVLADQWLPPMVYAPNQKNHALMESLKEMVLGKDAALHERQITALVNRPDASAYLGDIHCPTLLVVGENDAWSPVAQHEEMQNLLPDAQLEVIPEAGHFAPVEQPEAVIRVLRPFLLED